MTQFILQRHQTLITALQELLSSKANKAVMLATLNDTTLQLSARGKPKRVRELVPPDLWFESGKLEWLTQDGALLGLIWSPDEQDTLDEATLNLLTWLLAAARTNEGKRALSVLMTQLPEGVAWLNEQLIFEQVSRHFLELHHRQADSVIGRSFLEVFPERHLAAQLLEQGVLGYTNELPCEPLSIAGTQRWLRSRVRPYFGDEGAGVLWTVQDISAEITLSSGLAALLNAQPTPTALVNAQGKLIEASHSLHELCWQHTEQPLVQGQHISEWPLWNAGSLSAAAWATLLRQASSTQTSSAAPLQQAIKLSDQQQVNIRIHLADLGGLAATPLAGTPLATAAALGASTNNTSHNNSLSLTPGLQDKHLSDKHHQGKHYQENLYIVEVAPLAHTPEHSQLLNALIQFSPQPLLLLGPEEAKRGRPLMLLSQTALVLLGLDEKTQNTTQPFDVLLKQQQVTLTHPNGSLTTFSELCTQSLNQQELVSAVLIRPNSSRRHIELQAVVLQDMNLLLAPSRKPKAQSGRPEAQNAAQRPLSVYLEDVTSRRNLEERLHHNARHDALTGLPNWQGLSSSVQSLYASKPTPRGRKKTESKAAAFCLFIIAIDDFTALQALLGRTTSDHLLIQMASRLHQWRKDGRAARMEGAHFALLLPQNDTLRKLVHELQQTLSQTMRAGGREIHVSVSVGVSCEPSSLEQQLEEAQSALHAAQHKGTGRGQIEFYSPTVRQQDAELLNLSQEIHKGLPAQFNVLLQPIINLETGRVQGAELLLRWQHPERGNISPRTFLPMLEQSGLMPVLGEWLLDEVTTLHQRWLKTYPHLRLHLNVSGEELQSQSYLAHLRKMLKNNQQLSLEISAQGLLQEQDQQSTALKELSAQGCHLYIDDFGNASASITTLEQFALSGVKLHPSFVANLKEGSRQLSLLVGTVELMRRMDLQLIAVGVETQAQAELLRAAGCQAAQGYLYLPPCPLEEFEVWMSSQAPAL